MLRKSSPTFKSRISSRLAKFKKRASSIFSPSPPASIPQCSRVPDDNTGRLDVPSHRHEDTYLSPVSDSHRASVSTVNSLLAHPSGSPQACIRHLEDWAHQNCSSMHLAPPSPLQLSQGQPSAFQRPRSEFSGAHSFIVKDPVFIDHNVTSDSFMEKLLQQTIIGAEFDSSDRDPPPRCHPGTRLAILQRCLDFISQSHGEGKLHWVVGPAGVGKSAVMQMVAEKVSDSITFTSIFLSVNGRRDGTKAILTIAYQFAVKCEPYHQFIRGQIIRDPSLLRKSVAVQFQKFVVEPLILQRLFDSSRRFLVVIDGLDECENPLVQLKLLELITDFCITYPISPIVWIVASRPEPHITSFFERAEVQQVYTKEEMEIDSDEAREDVQRYLRDELKKIQSAYPTLRRRQEWPSEHEFTQIATAAGGLFAYASTVVRYIGDPYYRDPVTQLRNVLAVIDASAKRNMSGRDHPMAQLDALYIRILSNVHDDAMINTKKLLLTYSRYGWPAVKFREQCNMLGLTEDAAYAAVCHLHAVMKIPEPDKAAEEPLSYYHKSFEDFLFDFKRSGLFENVKDEAEQAKVHTVLRIVKEVPDGSDDVTNDERIECGSYGCLKSGYDHISLSWPGDERFEMTDDELCIWLYRRTMTDMLQNINSDHNFYESISCFHILTTRFNALGAFYPFSKLWDSTFDKFRHELMELGKLNEVPLRTLDCAAICGPIHLQFTSPIEIDVELASSWNPSCKHRKNAFSDSQQGKGWLTVFERCYGVDSDIKGPDPMKEGTEISRFDIVVRQEAHRQCFTNPGTAACNHCWRRFARYVMDNGDQVALVFVDSTRMSYVELSFVDPDDGVSEWRYRFFHSGPPMSSNV